MLAAECVIEALRGNAVSVKGKTGALILANAAQWITRIGRGLSQ